MHFNAHPAPKFLKDIERVCNKLFVVGGSVVSKELLDNSSAIQLRTNFFQNRHPTVL